MVSGNRERIERCRWRCNRDFAATVGFAPRLLHNIAGLIILMRVEPLQFGWDNCG
jgi:hypothetical protein